jgi:hypothetical protein
MLCSLKITALEYKNYIRHCSEFLKIYALAGIGFSFNFRSSWKLISVHFMSLVSILDTNFLFIESIRCAFIYVILIENLMFGLILRDLKSNLRHLCKWIELYRKVINLTNLMSLNLAKLLSNQFFILRDNYCYLQWLRERFICIRS